MEGLGDYTELVFPLQIKTNFSSSQDSNQVSGVMKKFLSKMLFCQLFCEKWHWIANLRDNGRILEIQVGNCRQVLWWKSVKQLFCEKWYWLANLLDNDGQIMEIQVGESSYRFKLQTSFVMEICEIKWKNVIIQWLCKPNLL